MWATSLGTGKIMSRVFPLCLTSPFTSRVRSRSCRSPTEPTGTGLDIGPKVSMPLARSHVLPALRAAACMSLADTSLKTATWEMQPSASPSGTDLQRLPNTSASSTSCWTFVTPSGMTMSSPSPIRQLGGLRNTVGSSGSSDSSSLTWER